MPVTRSKRKAAAAAASPPATPPKPAKTAKTAKAAKAAKAAKRATTAESDRPAPETPRCSHHLVKSEPESRLQNGHEMKFSIDDLMREPAATAHWDGVRNFEARNCIKRMKKGDLAFFYHSNTKKSRPSIVGIVEVVKEAYPGMSPCLTVCSAHPPPP